MLLLHKGAQIFRHNCMSHYWLLTICHDVVSHLVVFHVALHYQLDPMVFLSPVKLANLYDKNWYFLRYETVYFNCKRKYVWQHRLFTIWRLKAMLNYGIHALNNTNFQGIKNAISFWPKSFDKNILRVWSLYCWLCINIIWFLGYLHNAPASFFFVFIICVNHTLFALAHYITISHHRTIFLQTFLKHLYFWPMSLNSTSRSGITEHLTSWQL